MTKEIQLTQGKVALVDDEDFEWLNQWRWHAKKCYGGTIFYAVRRDPEDNAKTVWMHRVILGVPGDVLVDHVDRNGLNNTRKNIRIATAADNAHNRKIQKSNNSGYKGVNWHKHRELWYARIAVDGKRVDLGYYTTPEAAALAYNDAAVQYYGQFAVLNNVDESFREKRKELAESIRNAKARQGPRKDSRSGYKGVQKQGNRWIAIIRSTANTKYLGTFLSLEEAARAYNKAALETYGNGCYLNEV